MIKAICTDDLVLIVAGAYFESIDSSRKSGLNLQDNSPFMKRLSSLVLSDKKEG